MRIATYTRISTDEEHQPYSLEAQAERLKAYAKSQDGWRIARRFSDQASGAVLERPGLERALREAEAKRFELLLVYRVDRLARSVRGLAQILERLDQAGVLFRSATEPFDTASSAGRMMVQMLGVFAEFERATIVERTIAGMERKAARGEWTGGTVPFGYRLDAERRFLLPDPVEAPVVAEVFARYAERLEGSAALASWLTERGCRTRQGKPFNVPAVLTFSETALISARSPSVVASIRRRMSRSSRRSCSSARARSSPSAARTIRCGGRTGPTTCSPGSSAARAAASASSAPPRTATAGATPTTSASRASATDASNATPTACRPTRSKRRSSRSSSAYSRRSRSCAKRSTPHSASSTRSARGARPSSGGSPPS
jgi:DNA invertase Pin-like site-specific DNA recombinase